MPKFRVIVGESETNCKTDNAKDAIRRAIEKIWGRNYSFHVSADQYYTNPESATLYGVITKAAKGGGGHVITQTSVSVSRY